MPFSLFPNHRFSAITDLHPEFFEKQGIRFLMMDFDNTIVPYGIDEPTDEFCRWLESVKSAGIGLCVVSNSKKPRVKIFCAHHDIPCITHAKKPFQKGLCEAIRTFAINRAECALVGDQIFTDVLGGNSAGLSTILIRPIAFTNVWLRLRYWAEQPFILLGKLVNGYE